MLRVRTILDSLDAAARKKFTKLLPDLKPTPELYQPVKYPQALLSALPKENSYMMLGVITENMMRYAADDITLNRLFSDLDAIYVIPDPKKAAIRRSITTAPYLAHLVSTRLKLDTLTKGPMMYDTVVQFGRVEGHPDGQTATQLFEIKMTAQVEKNWKDYLFQAFSYAALTASATELYLVFPLQEQIVSFPLDTWSDAQRTAWRDLLVSYSETCLGKMVSQKKGMLIQQTYHIGTHVGKLPSLVDTLNGLTNSLPFQIFLGSPTSRSLHISDAELAEASSMMKDRRIYVHTPYIINLSTAGVDPLFIKNIQYSVASGCKGVVIHVGKSTSQDPKKALEVMRDHLLAAIPTATNECPILLETPAGQGTELLTGKDDFLAFVESFHDPRLKICVDTCHVFTCGHNPLDYLHDAYQTGLLHLVHFNDSATPCGACVDRHAFIGTGHIGVDMMEKMAQFCKGYNIPMVIE
jgi:deoxyribonuclease-4